MDRRSFVATLSAAPFVAGIGSRSFVDRPGVQLYTVRDAMAEDVDATLAALAEIGYREVEMAGTYGMTPAAFRRSLDA
ncbi:MAG: sugar phosphate isomerase/epimerase, partial [Longimicrobiales bacterium]